MSPRWPLLSFPERMPMIAGGWRNSGEPQMNWKTLAATVLAINFLAMPAFADEHGELDHMQTRLQQMQGVYNQMQQAHSSAERHKRSEDRRVGKACASPSRSRWWRTHKQKK